MTKGPVEIVSCEDIPAPVPGAARYNFRRLITGGVDVTMFDDKGITNVIDHKPTEQSAIRCAIRWQKRENAAVTKAAKKGKL